MVLTVNDIKKIKMLFRLAKIVRTKRDALLLLSIAAVVILIAYAIPSERIE